MNMEVWPLSAALQGEAIKRTDAVFPPLIRWIGFAWVAVSVPFTTATAALFADTPNSYLFILIFMACGAYTLPALFAAWPAVRNAPTCDRTSFALLQGGLQTAFTIGVAVLLGIFTGWRWANELGAPAVAVCGVIHVIGVAKLVRSRSGRRALSVDLVEFLAAMVAICAPLFVWWGPSIVNSEQSWFTVPLSLAMVCCIAGTYWGVALCVRLGPGRGAFEVSALALALFGLLNVTLQIANGLSGFTLPAAPLVAINALCFSQYLLIPLNTPLILRQGLGRLPLTAQVRGAGLATGITLVGLVVLLATTLVVADERPWSVPFSLVTVSVLLVLAGLRQIAMVGETRRLYEKVERSSDERRLLLTQLLERNIQDRHHFAGQLYEQAVAAYTSFTLLAGTGRPSMAPGGAAVAKATALVGGDLARHAETVRELVQAIQPLESDTRTRQRLQTPIRAYLAAVYDDRPTPELTISMTEDLALDWITETAMLQIVQQGLHNIWQHSGASTVHLSVVAEDDDVVLHLSDDGRGFDATRHPESSGIAVMRASAAAVGGSLEIDSQPGNGTSVTAKLRPGRSESDAAVAAAAIAPVRNLRVVRNELPH